MRHIATVGSAASIGARARWIATPRSRTEALEASSGAAGGRRRLWPKVVDVWIVHLDHAPVLWEWLDAEERTRLVSFVRSRDRRRFGSLHTAVRGILAGYL